jgi:hypothetical protein
MHVSDNDWYTILNSVLPKVQEIEVKEETDTSGLSVLKNAFIEYLSNKQARRDSPYQIRVGLCVRQTTNGVIKYYFSHQGFEDYLKTQKIPYDMGLMRETLKRFGAEEDVLTYFSSAGEERRFPCWSKIEDNNIEEAYNGAMEVEEGDKANLGKAGVSEVTEDEEKAAEKEKAYTDEDLKKAESMF